MVFMTTCIKLLPGSLILMFTEISFVISCKNNMQLTHELTQNGNDNLPKIKQNKICCADMYQI